MSFSLKYITNLWFADDIDAVAEEEQKLEALIESFDKTCAWYKRQISAEKTKLIIIVPMVSRGRSGSKDRSLEQ